MSDLVGCLRRLITYTYDADGNLTQRVDSTGTTNFAYDQLNRVVTENAGTNVCTITVYTTAGSVTDHGTVCQQYDGINLTAYTDTSGTTDYFYDADNRLASLVQPGGTTGCSVLPHTLDTLCTAFAYDSDNRRTTTQYPGGATLTIGFDNAGNETSAVGETSTGSTLTSFTYCYRVLTSTGACPTSGTITDTSVATQAYENDPRATQTTYYAYNTSEQLCWAGSTYSSTATCTAPPSGDDSYAYWS